MTNASGLTEPDEKLLIKYTITLTKSQRLDRDI